MEVDLCFDTTSLVNLDTIIPNITIDVFVSLNEGKNYTKTVSVDMPPLALHMSAGKCLFLLLCEMFVSTTVLAASFEVTVLFLTAILLSKCLGLKYSSLKASVSHLH